MTSTGWTLAVDLGTTSTAAAIRRADGQVEPVRLGAVADTMPSAVLLADGQWRAGQAALDMRPSYRETFVSSPTSRLGDGPLVLGEHLVTPEQIVAQVLDAVLEHAVRASEGVYPTRLVLTHPVRWSTEQLAAMREAARLSGFGSDQVVLLAEPVAVVHAGGTSWEPGAQAAVVDLGAGTCDVTVVHVTDDPVPGKDVVVLAHESDPSAGGEHLDDLLHTWTTDELIRTGHADLVQELGHPHAFAAAVSVRAAVHDARHALSEHDSAQLDICVLDREVTVTITREQFQALAAPAVRTVSAMVTNLGDQPTTLFVVGGVSSTPCLAQAVHDATTVVPTAVPQPAVVTGALHTPWAVLTPDRLFTLTAERVRARQPEPVPEVLEPPVS
ncbi:MAG: Hsp70 family protein [Micrococcales bacterium]|nr:Hsp70 family protein [Micrococcales bacterium]